MNKSFWKGFGAAVLFFGILALLLPFLGLLPMSVTSGKNLLDWWGRKAVISSFKWYAPNEKIPRTAQSEQGKHHYKEMCLRCHGAPNVAPMAWSQAMLPKPPMLWKSTGEMSDGAIFYVIKNGIKMTGMPAWQKGHSDKDIWSMVKFIRELHAIDESVVKEFQEYQGRGSGHGH